MDDERADVVVDLRRDLGRELREKENRSAKPRSSKTEPIKDTILTKGQTIRFGSKSSTASSMTLPERAYSIEISCPKAVSSRQRRCESELCAVHRNKIFMIACILRSGVKGARYERSFAVRPSCVSKVPERIVR